MRLESKVYPGTAISVCQILIDVSVMSHSWHREESFARNWLRTLPPSRVIVPAVAFEIIDAGIRSAAANKPILASELKRWRYAWQRRVTIIDREMCLPVLDRLKAIKPLKGLWVRDHRAKKSKIPHVLETTAISIAFGLPIHTMSSREYLRIHDFEELPGCFDFSVGEWVVPPTETEKIQIPSLA